MYILERLRPNSSLLRIAHAMVCAVFLLNLVAHFAHQHEASSSSERLTCAHCCAFTGMADVPKALEPPSARLTDCGVAFTPAQHPILQRPRSSHRARGPPSFYLAFSTALS
jgi:hypothetical protein